MSFLDDIVDFGKSAIQYFSGNGTAAALLRTVGMIMVVNQLNQNKGNDPNPAANIDDGVRLQIPPATNNKIPILYGTAYFGGIITDAVMTNTNKTMYYCLTLSEKTGTKLSDGQASDYVFKDVYWNDQRIVFNSDGITANYTVDRNGVVDNSISNQVKVWCYKGSTAKADHTIPENYTNTNTVHAATIMPNWTTSTHFMNNLLFSIVRVDYNREKNITGIGDMKFQIQNNMKLPGDCLYDYMTNTRYGAGIDPAEINSQ
jgi:hypothetical protein